MKALSVIFAGMFFLPLAVFAGESSYSLMAPLSGRLQGSVDLTTYLKGMVEFIIGMAGILAVIMIIVCGIRLLGTPSASARNEAKDCIRNAILGLLLAIAAWVILFSINPLLLSSELRLADVSVAPESPAIVAPPTGNYLWSAGATCGQQAGKIVAVVPPSYCSGSAPSPSSVCCGYTNSPFRPPAGTPVGTTPPAAGTGTPPPTSPEATSVAFTQTSYTVSESAGSLPITLTRSSGSGTLTVSYVVQPANATAESTYDMTTGTVSFPAGVTTATLSLPIIDNTIGGGSQQLRVLLSDPTGTLSFNGIVEILVTVTDNDSAANTDFTPPTITIAYPPSGIGTTSANIVVDFTAQDNRRLRRIEYTYQPPAPLSLRTSVICNESCPSPSASMRVPMSLITSSPGLHSITIRACDDVQCTTKPVSLVVEPTCNESQTLHCKLLPTGQTTGSPLCASNSGPGVFRFGTGGINLGYLSTLPTSELLGLQGSQAVGTNGINFGYNYTVNGTNVNMTMTSTSSCSVGYDYEGTPSYTCPIPNAPDYICNGYCTVSNCVIGANGSTAVCNISFSPTIQTSYIAAAVDAWKFKMTDTGVGGQIHVAGGNQIEWPLPDLWNGTNRSSTVNCGAQTCYYDEYSYDCQNNLPQTPENRFAPSRNPANVVVSISDAPGDLSSSANTVPGGTVDGIQKTVSGYCGDRGTTNAGASRLTFTISASQSGPGICRVLRNRTYYVNVQTVPTFSYYGDIYQVGNVYSLFWNILTN